MYFFIVKCMTWQLRDVYQSSSLSVFLVQLYLTAGWQPLLAAGSSARIWLFSVCTAVAPFGSPRGKPRA